MDQLQKQRIIDSLRSLGRDREFRKMVSQTLEYLKKPEVITDSDFTLKLYRIIAGGYFYLAKYHEAMDYYNKIHALSITTGTDLDIASAFMGIGGCYFHLNDIAKAEEYMLKAKPLYETEPDNQNLCNIYNWLGCIYNEQKKLYQSLDMNIKALKQAERLNFTDTVETSSIGVALTFFYIGDVKKALEYIRKAEETNKVTNNRGALADIYNNYGIFYKELKEFGKAVKYYRKALELRLSLFPDDYMRIGHTYANLAATEISYGDLESAKKNIEIALENYKHLLNSEELIQSLIIHKALISYHEKDINSLKENLDQYESYYDEFNIHSDKKMYLMLKSSYYESTGNFKQALQYHVDYSEVQQSESTKYHQKVIDDMEMRIDYEKSKARAEIYKLRNDELAVALETRDKLFSVIAHDLRGPVSNVIEIMRFYKESPELMNPDEFDSVFNELYCSASNAYTLLQNLLSWARTQMKQLTPVKTPLNIPKLAEDVLKQVAYQIEKKELKIEKSINCTSQAYGDKNMIDFIVRNLLTNAIKFSKPKGIISFSTHCDNDRVYVNIKDEGVGIPKDKLVNIFKVMSNKSTRGTHNEQGSGLALVLCKDFIDLNDGNIEAESEVGQGTSFKVILPTYKDS